MNRIVITKDGVQTIPLTLEEIQQLEEERLLQELEQTSQPSQQELEDAEFEIKLITKLSEWGIF